MIMCREWQRDSWDVVSNRTSIFKSKEVNWLNKKEEWDSYGLIKKRFRLDFLLFL